jgi:hypothetical protein
MRDITETVSVRDVFGLGDREDPFAPVEATNVPAEKSRFTFRRDDAKIDEFMVWLKEQEKKGILELTPAPQAAGVEPWTNGYVRSSYQKGLRDANVKIGRLTPENQLGSFQAAFQLPVHQERVQLAYTRVFTDLEGITVVLRARVRSREQKST